MKNKKTILIAVAALLVLAAFVGIYLAARPESAAGSKTITVEVVHSDKTSNVYTIQTDAEILADAMNEKGLLGENLDGMYNTIDGETADWSRDNSWWCLYVNGESAMEGANTLVIRDGDSFKWVYTIG